MENKYLTMPLNEIQEQVEQLENKCDLIWEESLEKDLSFEEMSELRRPYLKELRLADAAITMLTPKDTLESEPYDALDTECQMPLDEFISCCEEGVIMNSDGFGVYADKDKVYKGFEASPWEIVHGFIRRDFEFVCWYNK